MMNMKLVKLEIKEIIHILLHKQLHCVHFEDELIEDQGPFVSLSRDELELSKQTLAKLPGRQIF